MTGERHRPKYRGETLLEVPGRDVARNTGERRCSKYREEASLGMAGEGGRPRRQGESSDGAFERDLKQFAGLDGKLHRQLGQDFLGVAVHYQTDSVLRSYPPLIAVK